MKPPFAVSAMHPGPARRRDTPLACGIFRKAMSPILLIALLIVNVPRGHAAGAMFTGNLANFDVRYPPSLPNDLEIVLYGDGLKTNDVAGAYLNSRWGAPVSITGSVNTDFSSPAFRLDCVVVRYAGPPLPALVGSVLHFGVRLRIGAVVTHQEIWWSINGQRILRPCDPQIIWSCTTNGWLVCVANPTTQPMYVYGARFFAVSTNAPDGTIRLLPTLDQLNTGIIPSQFGATDWTTLALPPDVFGPSRVFCIPAWCRTYFRVPGANRLPIVFQIAARNVPEAVLPLPAGTMAPNPQDWNGENGTMAILTTRPTLEYAEDLNNDGVVGIPDFNQLRSSFGATSQDR